MDHTLPPPESPLQAVLDVLRRGQSFLVCSHTRPDGDSVGSMLALGMLLEQMGKRADLVTADRIPTIYSNLPGVQAIRPVQRADGSFDAAILLECDALQRAHIRGLRNFFQVNIDHHATGRPFANLNWIDREASSAGEMVYRLALAGGAVLTPQMATCLYTTVLTDTGGFCYGNTRASTFAFARDLVLAGANPIDIARDVYFSMATSRLLLLGAALANLKREGRLAWLSVSQHDMIRACAADEDCEGIVNFALSIAGVEAAFFLRELPDRSVRVSLRGKGQVDVASVAAGLGGGGHQSAAGCTLPGPLPRALDEVLSHLRPAVVPCVPDHAAAP